MSYTELDRLAHLYVQLLWWGMSVLRLGKGMHRFKVPHPELISSNNWAFSGTSYASSGPSSTVNPFLQKVITLVAVSISRPAGAFWSGMTVDGVSSSPRRCPAPWKGPVRDSSSSNLRREPLQNGRVNTNCALEVRRSTLTPQHASLYPVRVVHVEVIEDRAGRGFEQRVHCNLCKSTSVGHHKCN